MTLQSKVTLLISNSNKAKSFVTKH